MQEETVKYNNYLNKVSFKGLKSNELNVIMALCSKMKEQDVRRITFSYSELKECMFVRKTTDEELRKFIRSAAKKLGDVNGEVELPDGKVVYFDLFPTRTDDPKERTFTIRVNEDVKFVLNDLTKNFTLFELNEFIQLSGKYSKHLYRILKQFKNTGKYIVNSDDLKMFLDVPNSYTNKRIAYEVLAPAVEELQEKGLFKNLTYIPQKTNRRGSPVVGYIFTFTPEKAVRNENRATQEQKKATKQPKKKKEEPKVDTLDEIIELIDSYHLDMGIKSTLACSRKAEELGRSLEYVTDVLEIVKGQSCDNVAAKLMSLLMNGYDKPKKRRTTKFSNFEERDYDFDELEKMLIGN